ncbi:MAG: D-glycero-beta-D-manno-heptose 1,7-bisphosphate 7-phosphatase [Campylobacteraceae bacterium]|jgi:D-glycero-D-manno-heptose 1,7-bisphosphate phosphatase|nr:D-glycero-beta-D-manno-heptose 1,7-bisphosphate 7-phosphatase [Campylobacteraceae bacterium]
MKNRAIFLDRDGVINIDKGYVYKKEDFVFAPDVFDTLYYLQSKGYLLFVVTNQSGIARGYYTKDDFLKLTKYMIGEFTKRDIKITKLYYCPHAPEANCQCRKPNPKMLFDAQKEFDIDMNVSWLIGDKTSDIEAGLRAGVGNLVYVGEGECAKAHKIKSLNEVVRLIS